MNDDAFERKLQSLAGALPRPDPTPQWKADILARARREACASGVTSHRILPPRWLMTVWCTTWAVIAVLHFSTPSYTASTQSSGQLAEAQRGTGTDTGAPPQGTDSSSLTLIAFHRELSSGATTTRFDIP